MEEINRNNTEKLRRQLWWLNREAKSCSVQRAAVKREDCRKGNLLDLGAFLLVESSKTKLQRKKGESSLHNRINSSVHALWSLHPSCVLQTLFPFLVCCFMFQLLLSFLWTSYVDDFSLLDAVEKPTPSHGPKVYSAVKEELNQTELQIQIPYLKEVFPEPINSPFVPLFLFFFALFRCGLLVDIN